MRNPKSITIALLAVALSLPLPGLSADGDIPLFRVQRQVNMHAIDISGTVAASKTAKLTAQISGRVAAIAGHEGDLFSRGTELVRIDDTALRAKRDAAVAQRSSAEAAIRNAQVQLRREISSPQSQASSSAPGGMGMPAMMDQAFTNPMQNMMGMRSRGSERYSDVINRETQLTQANTQYRQADAQINEIDAALRDARTLAPFDGVIETVYVEVGDPMQPGQPLLVFSDTKAYQVVADVPVRVLPVLQEGMSLPVRLDGADPAVPARISRIFPVADPNQHTVRVEMDLPEGARTTVGQYAEVRVPTDHQDTTGDLVIPQTAVVRKGGLPLVFQVNAEGLLALRVVRLGGSTAPDGVIVLAGVREGDVIVAEPPPGLRAGEQLRVPAPERK